MSVSKRHGWDAYREARKTSSWEEIEEAIPKIIPELVKNPGMTRWFYLWHTFDWYNDYAVVFGSVPVDEEMKDEYPSGYTVLMKIGRQYWNSVMHEYDVDWLFPTIDDETGELYVYEYDANTVEDALDGLEWLKKNWKTITEDKKEKEANEKN